VAINDGVVSNSACFLGQMRSKAPNRRTVVCRCPFNAPLFALLPIHRRWVTPPTFSRPRTTPSPLKLPKSLPPNGQAKLAAAPHEVLPEVRRFPPKTKRWECREDRSARAKGRVPVRSSGPAVALSSTLATFPSQCPLNLRHLSDGPASPYDLGKRSGPISLHHSHSFSRYCGIGTTSSTISSSRCLRPRPDDHLAHIVALRKCGLTTLSHFHPNLDVNFSALFSHRPSFIRTRVSLSLPDAEHTCLADAHFVASRRTQHVTPTVPYLIHVSRVSAAMLCDGCFGVRTSTGGKLP